MIVRQPRRRRRNVELRITLEEVGFVVLRESGTWFSGKTASGARYGVGE